jgi:hypothetical protein
MNYSCLPNDDGTLKGSTRMSTTVGMDIDHISREQMQPVMMRILSKKDELGLLLLEKSARGAGYHLVFKRKPELSQEENLRWASELLGVEFDKGAKDITRVFFTTTNEDLLFLDDGILASPQALSKRRGSPKAQSPKAQQSPPSFWKGMGVGCYTTAFRILTLSASGGNSTTRARNPSGQTVTC